VPYNNIRKQCFLILIYYEVTGNMKNTSTLKDLRQGQTAKVKQLLMVGSIRRRLQDIGLIEGTEVECLQRSPAGDPTAYLIRGAVIALRSEDSANILIFN
jgi:ferrous iron transport protein A